MADINVEEVLAKLTEAEKISLLSGADFWHTKALPAHGVPSLRLSDGPNGVRGTTLFNGVPAACFPCGTALAATWDTPLLERAGALMGDEAIAKGAHVLLGPCINMQRSPLGGRGFESLSEDPMLAGLGAAALVKGIQSRGVAATIKHFVCNDQEHERMAYDAQVSQRALREIYLLPFQIAVRDAGPHCFMTAYNKVNGTHVSENKTILQDILRDEWKWDGLLMSDWFGTYSTSEAMNAGLDLEMPGPTRWRSALLRHAISSNKVSQHTLDERARAVLNLVKRCAKSGVPENAKETTNDTPETAALLRKLATDAIVLMKNDNNVLPFKKDKSTLIVGPSGKVSVYCGGGSSSLLPYHAISPMEGIMEQVTGKVTFTVGAHTHKELPTLGLHLKTAEGKIGVTFTPYNDPPGTKDRKSLGTLTLSNTDINLMDYKSPEVASDLWYADIDGYLTAEEDGEFDLGLGVFGTAKLYVDGKLLIDNETMQRQGTLFFGAGTVEETGVLPVKEGQKYHIKVEYGSGATCKLRSDGIVTFGGGVRIGGCMRIDPEKEIAHAVELAKQADQVIICAGLNADWEAEGADRESMALPGHTNALITALSTTNPHTVVVLQSGTPVSMPWLGATPALIHAWYGGNETGHAIADILFGTATPSGKLSLSFPVRVQDNPAYLNYASQRGRVLYGEDVYIGYRYYEAVDRAVLFPFGHGLSYTTFSFSALQISTAPAAGSKPTQLTVSLTLTNTGSVSGAEVAQVYVAHKNPSVPRPGKELKGFEKVFLKPGESRKVHVVMEMKYVAAFWDEGRGMWGVEKGAYEVFVGGSSALGEGALRGGFELAEGWWWSGV